MLIAIKLKFAIAAGLLAAPVVMQSLAPATVATDTELAEISPADFDYRMAGDFSRAGRPVESPHSTARLSAKLRIMRRQVTVAEYRRCMDAGACPRIGSGRRPSGRSDGRRELARRASLCRLDEQDDRAELPAADRSGMELCGSRKRAERGCAAGRSFRSGAGLDRPLRSRIGPRRLRGTGAAAGRHLRAELEWPARRRRQRLGMDRRPASSARHSTAAPCGSPTPIAVFVSCRARTAPT